jgi:hypothetical protein
MSAGPERAAALEYAADGIEVLPVRFVPPDGKRPLTRNGHRDATTDARAILRYWEQWPGAGIGGCTGRGLVVIDVDPRHDGDNGIADATDRLGRLPRTKTATTASGGWHHWFRIPAGVEIRNSAGRLAPGVDVRGSGGWAIMPPSRAPWGSWAWSDRSEMAELPDSWLTALQEQSTPRAKSSEEWAALTASLPEGQRNVGLTTLAGHLARRDVDPMFALEALLAFNEARGRPPLPEREVMTIFGSIAGRERRRRAARAGVPAADLTQRSLARAHAGARESSAQHVSQISSSSFPLTSDGSDLPVDPYWYFRVSGLGVRSAPGSWWRELDFLTAEWQAGELQPHPVPLGPLPSRAGEAQRRIAEHIRLLLGLRVTSGEVRPLPYPADLAVRAGVAADKRNASRALRALVRHGVLIDAGTLPPLPPHRDGTKTYAPPEGAADFGDLDVRAELIQRLKQRRTT